MIIWRIDEQRENAAPPTERIEFGRVIEETFDPAKALLEINLIVEGNVMEVHEDLLKDDTSTAEKESGIVTLLRFWKLSNANGPQDV